MGFVQYQVERDHKDHLVQPFLAQAWPEFKTPEDHSLASVHSAARLALAATTEVCGSCVELWASQPAAQALWNRHNSTPSSTVLKPYQKKKCKYLTPLWKATQNIYAEASNSATKLRLISKKSLRPPSEYRKSTEQSSSWNQARFPQKTKQLPVITMNIQRGPNKAFLFWCNNFSLVKALVAYTTKIDLTKVWHAESYSMVVLALKSFYNTDKDKYPTYLLIRCTNKTPDLFTSMYNKPKSHSLELVS